ncbi:MAG: hypothetical protein MUP63_03350 [Candidatus Nanohaloarchaeota archaeon QJJ-7]|nr:hypothetical protein [Candidatus Nanohaloarchaeota archaeon QJJ-7]
MTEKSEREAIEEFENGGIPNPSRDVTGDISKSSDPKDRSYGLLKEDEADVDPAGEAPEEFETDLDIEYDGILREIDELMDAHGNDLVVAEDLGQEGVRFSYATGEEEESWRMNFTLNRKGEVVSIVYTGPSTEEGEEYGVDVPMSDEPLTHLADPVYGGLSLKDLLVGDYEERFNQIPQGHQNPDHPEPAAGPERLKDDRDNPRYH